MDAAARAHLDAFAGILRAYKIREGRNTSQLWNGLRKKTGCVPAR
jgi:hypothetical protein